MHSYLFGEFGVVQVRPCNYRIDCRSVLGRVKIKTEKSRGAVPRWPTFYCAQAVYVYKKNQNCLWKKPPDKRLILSRLTTRQVPLCFGSSDRQEIRSLQETIRHSLFPKPSRKQEFIRVVVSPELWAEDCFSFPHRPMTPARLEASSYLCSNLYT